MPNRERSRRTEKTPLAVAVSFARPRRKSNRAFTLIELLVVIAIIGILAAMLLPALAGAKKQGQSTLCKNHLHEMGIALHMYVDDDKVYPYHGYQATTTPVPLYWPYALQYYYRLSWTNVEYHCPSYNGIVGQQSYPEGYLLGSYSYNVFGATLDGDPPLGLGVAGLIGVGGSAPIFTPNPPHPEGDVVAPSEMFAMMDTLAVSAFFDYWYNPTVMFKMGSGGWSGWDLTGCFLTNSSLIPPPAGRNYSIAIPHGKAFNVLFCDDHVTPIRFADLFNPTNTAPNWNIDHQPHRPLWMPGVP